MDLINNRYKLLVVDIDGTLLGKDGTISAEDKHALSQVVASGIRISLSSGRVAQACLKILNWLSLDGYHMFSDGALISDSKKGEEVYVKPIGAGLVKRLVGLARLNEINLDLYSTDDFFCRAGNMGY